MITLVTGCPFICACEVYSLEHAIVCNSKKSTVLVCRNKAMRHAVCPSFIVKVIVNGDVILESEKVKYLEHIICSDLSDDEDMMRQRRHLYAQGNVISRSFHMCSIAVKNRLYWNGQLVWTPGAGSRDRT